MIRLPRPCVARAGSGESNNPGGGKNGEPATPGTPGMPPGGGESKPQPQDR